MNFRELNVCAERILRRADPIEADIRRGVSALYYGLFHQLTEFGAALFAVGGVSLQAKVARSFSHREMRTVCKDLVGRNPQVLGRRFGHPMLNPDARLVSVAKIFIRLQEAREAADYDFSVAVTHQTGLDRLRDSDQATNDFYLFSDDVQKTVFVAALLLGDRSRHG